MKKHYLLYFSLIFLLAISCKKEPLPILPSGNNPIYTLSGMLNDDSLDFKVGLETVSIKHGFSDVYGVFSYYSEIESVRDNEKIRVEILRQEVPRTGMSVEVFKTSEVPLFVHEKGRVLFDFGGVGNQLNNFQIQDANGYYVNIRELALPRFGIHTIKAKIDDYGQSVFQFQVKHGYEDRQLFSGYNVQGSATEIFLNATHDNYAHEWYINNQLVGTDSAYVGNIQDGVHEIVHRVYDAQGNVSSTSGLVRFKGGKDFWDMKVNYRPEETFETYNYGRMIISYFKDDRWYSSAYGISNKGKNIAVTGVSMVEDESSLEQLLAFDLAFDAQLFTEDLSDSLSLTGVNGNFLIGLP